MSEITASCKGLSKAYFESLDYTKYSKSVQYSHKLRIKTIEKLIPIPSLPIEARALDIGCGSGIYSVVLLDKGFSVSSIDVADTALAQIRRFCTNKGIKDISIMKMSAEKLGFEDNKFDLIIFSEVIYLVSNPRKALNEIYRVLKPNGTLIYSQNNCFGLHLGVRDLLKYVFARNKRDREYRYFRFPFWKSLSLLRKAGFLIKEVVGVPIIPWRINKHLQKFDSQGRIVDSQGRIESIGNYFSNKPLIKLTGESVIIRCVKAV